MVKEIDGIMNKNQEPLDQGNMEDRRRAMKLRKRTKKKIRKQRDKQSSIQHKEHDTILPSDQDLHNDIPTTDAETQPTPTMTQQRDDQDQHTNDNQLQQQINQISHPDDTTEYVTPPIDLSAVDCYGQDIVQQFSDIFKHFETLGNKRKQKVRLGTGSKTTNTNDDPDTAPSNPLLSGKKLKAQQRYTLDELKTLATVPDVVEAWDTSAMDPLLLVDLKSYRNTVPVPIHWRQRQKYLYQNRYEEKPPFVLPDFIKNTGVMEARDNLKKEQERKRQKTKTRERRNPKLGKTDLDYQDLHDAFFLYQTEPHLTCHGDLYFERKETVSKFKNKKPGELSDELKEALGILSTPLAPPPWLLQMQRYGPPPNYPHLKIPGLNAPIPEGAQWGLQKGGWGLVPVDGFNRPLYGDIFKNDSLPSTPNLKDDSLDRTLWGELEDEQDSTDDNDDNDSTNMIDIPTTNAMDQPISVLDTTERVKPIRMNVGLELETGKRKRQQGDNNKKNDDVIKFAKLYDIIPAKDTTDMTGWMGSQHTYDLSSIGSRRTGPTLNSIGGKEKTQDVTVSLDPSALNDYGTAVKEMYQKAQEEHVPKGVGDQELKNMYTEHAKRQAKKKRQMDIRNADKKKEFRF